MQLQTLASPFHRYIMPSVRRVYIDTEDMRKLKEKAQALEAQVHQLKKDKKRVMKEQNKRLREKSEELERYKSKYQKLKETKTKASGTKTYVLTYDHEIGIETVQILWFLFNDGC